MEDEQELSLEEAQGKLSELKQVKDTVGFLISEQIAVREKQELSQDVNSLDDVFQLLSFKYERRGLLLVKHSINANMEELQDLITELIADENDA